MAGRSGRIGLVVALVGLLMPLPAWAGSAQAALTVGVVVPARCAVRVAASLAAGDGIAPGAREAVAMRCTKGSLPSPTGSAGPSAVGPRITRDLVMMPATAPTGHPRPLSEAGELIGIETPGPRLIVTVNF